MARRFTGTGFATRFYLPADGEVPRTEIVFEGMVSSMNVLHRKPKSVVSYLDLGDGEFTLEINAGEKKIVITGVMSDGPIMVMGPGDMTGGSERGRKNQARRMSKKPAPRTEPKAKGKR